MLTQLTQIKNKVKLGTEMKRRSKISIKKVEKQKTRAVLNFWFV